MNIVFFLYKQQLVDYLVSCLGLISTYTYLLLVKKYSDVRHHEVHAGDQFWEQAKSLYSTRWRLEVTQAGSTLSSSIAVHGECTLHGQQCVMQQAGV